MFRRQRPSSNLHYGNNFSGQQCIDKGNYKTALVRVSEALEWPENLGVGKPYDSLVDTSSEDLLYAVIYQRMGNTSRAEEYLSAIKDSSKQEFFKIATTKIKGKYPKIASMLGNMYSSMDKKLF